MHAVRGSFSNIENFDIPNKVSAVLESVIFWTSLRVQHTSTTMLSCFIKKEITPVEIFCSSIFIVFSWIYIIETAKWSILYLSNHFFFQAIYFNFFFLLFIIRRAFSQLVTLSFGSIFLMFENVCSKKYFFNLCCVLGCWWCCSGRGKEFPLLKCWKNPFRNDEENTHTHSHMHTRQRRQ